MASLNHAADGFSTGDPDQPLKTMASAERPRWNTSPLSLAIAGTPSLIAVPTLALIPSPLAQSPESSARPPALLNGRVSSAVTELFERTRQANNERPGEPSMRDMMLSGSLPLILPLSTNHENGCVVYLRQPQSDTGVQQQGPGATGKELRQEWVYQNLMIKL